MENLPQQSTDALLSRQKVLEGEMQSNDDENRLMQTELNSVYEELDRRRG